MQGASPRGGRAWRALAVVFAALHGATPAAAGEAVAVGTLLAPQPLPDVWQGAKDAPVTVIEYASMTCTHCAAFHAETWPTLKAKYIDTGKLRFVLREFPLDPVATAAFMLGRCAGPDRRNALLDLLFDQQKTWAFVDHKAEALAGTVKQAGMTETAFETCLKDQDFSKRVIAERDLAGQDFGVEATPTFFIDGVRYSGEMTIDEFDRIILPLLKG